MSDQFFKPEERAVSEGAQFPADVLTAEQEQRQRSGFSGNQNTMADCIGRGTQSDIPQGAHPAVKPNVANGQGTRPIENVSGMSLSGAPVTVVPCDRKTIEGSTPGDSRPKGSPAVLPANPAPRQGMTQARVCSSKLDSNTNLAPFSEVVD